MFKELEQPNLNERKKSHSQTRSPKKQKLKSTFVDEVLKKVDDEAILEKLNKKSIWETLGLQNLEKEKIVFGLATQQLNQAYSLLKEPLETGKNLS